MSGYEIEFAVDDKDDWQPFAWVTKREAVEMKTNPICGRCGLPVFSLFAPELGYWEWRGIGLAKYAILCQRHASFAPVDVGE